MSRPNLQKQGIYFVTSNLLKNKEMTRSNSHKVELHDAMKDHLGVKYMFSV